MSQIQIEYSGGANNPDPLPQSNIQSVEFTDVYNINYDSGDTCAITSVSEPGPLVQFMSVGTKNIYYKLGAAYNQRIGMLAYIATSIMIGSAPRQIVATLSKTGTPTGTIYCRIYDYSNALVHEYSTVSAATLTNLDATYTFTDLANTNTMQHKSKLVIVFTGGDATNYLNINVSDTDAFDGQNTVLYRMASDSNGAVEGVNPTQDLAGTISL